MSMNSDSDEVVTGSGNSSEDESQNGETMELPEVGNLNLIVIYDYHLDFNVSRLLWIKMIFCYHNLLIYPLSAKIPINC